MKFIDAFDELLQGNKIYLPTFVTSKYVYINKDGYIVNDLGYRIPIDVNDDNWRVFKEEE